MKKGTPRNPKVADLAERLSIELFAAVGILEMLWHFAAEFAPAGDIGRHSNLTIAKALCWRGKPDKLIVTGLVPAHWIDVCEPHRLVVHGWPEHCDDSVHMKLARAKQFFFDGTAPNIRRLPSSERALLERFYAESVRTESALETHERVAQGQGKAKADVVLDVFPEGDARGNPTAVITSPSDGWERYLGIFVAAGKPMNDSDLQKALRMWLSLEIVERLAATRDIEATCRATSESQFIPFPVNHLMNKPWTRTGIKRVLPDPPTKGQQTTSEVARIMRERRQTL